MDARRANIYQPYQQANIIFIYFLKIKYYKYNFELNGKANFN